ncbi:MAG: hypothetical protein CVV53_01045 [Spirochaetae bacterium HGW-Spirochaetae-9]|nr:MAG: hypothetical protein CVV53_01045 [Spirochaetae bacterium HGW-Spirochaetae-9]
MKKTTIYFVAALAAAAFLMAGPAMSGRGWLAAQESSAATAAADADPFDISAFDSGVGEATTSENAQRVEFLFGGSFIPSAGVTATSGFQGYAASSSLSGKLFGKATLEDYGSLYIAYGLSQQFLQGSGGDAPVVPGKSLSVPTFTLTEIYYSFDIRKVLFARLGNQLIAWGPSKIWSAVDFINLEKADAFQSIDLRVGKPGLRLHVPMESSNLFAFADFSGTVKSGVPQDIIESTNLGFRYDRSLAGFEFGFTGYFGSGIQGRGGFDFSGRALGSTIYGEVAFLPAYDAYDFSWSAVAGVERKLGDLRKVTLSGEFFYNAEGMDDESGYPAPPVYFLPTYVGKYYGYLGLSWDDLFSPDLSTSVSLLANLSDGSVSARLTESVALKGIPPFSVILGWTGGGEKKAFTYYSGDSSLSLTIQSRIEF